MRLGRLLLLTLSLAAASVGTAGCSYDPHFEDGTLRCSTSGQCPEGFQCQMNLCYSKAGAALPQPLRLYVGRWTLAYTSTVYTSCDDGFTDTTLLSTASMPSRMELKADSAKTGLDSTWLCQLHLSLDEAGAYLDEPNPSCTDTSDDPAYTWTATSFDVYTTNGMTATHSATYQRLDSYKDGSTVNCEQSVTATLTK